MPLRTRILVVTVALFLVGLGAANFTTYHFLSSFLVDRVDDQLDAATAPVAAELRRTAPPHRGEHDSFLPDGTYAALVDERGRMRREAGFAFGRDAPRPKIPTELVRSQIATGEQALTTVRAVSGPTEFRLIAKPLGEEGAVVVALPLTEVRATERRLLLIGGVVSGLVLVAIGAAAYGLTRRELRPLERMAEQSGAIAAGDLSRRVEPADPRTEVGQLGGALNTMLAQIERAFTERVAAEQRLRPPRVRALPALPESGDRAPHAGSPGRPPVERVTWRSWGRSGSSPASRSQAPARGGTDLSVALPPKGDSSALRHEQERTAACCGRRSAQLVSSDRVGRSVGCTRR